MPQSPKTKKAPKKSPVARFLANLGYALFLLLCLFIGTTAGWIGKSKLLTSLVRNVFNPKPVSEVFNGKDSLTVLMLGCDEDRYFKGTFANGSPIRRKYARSDMILVAKLDFANSRITGVSIPRDTACQLPGFRRMKINAYHSIGRKGEEDALAERAVEHLLRGVDIERVLVIDYEAFKQLVDLVGGVDVVVPKAMNYDDFAGDLHIHLKPGPQRLDGNDAMGFVRFRHDNSGDFARQDRQKQFLASFKEAVWRNKLQLPRVAELGKEVLNNALGDEEIAALALFAKSVPAKSIQMGVIPTLPGGGSYLRVDKRHLPETLQKFGLLPKEKGSLSALR